MVFFVSFLANQSDHHQCSTLTEVYDGLLFVGNIETQTLKHLLSRRFPTVTSLNLPTAAATPSNLWRARKEEEEVERNRAGVRLWGRPTLLASWTDGWGLENTEPSSPSLPTL